MNVKNIHKAVFFMAVLSLLLGLFGCQKAPMPAKHELSEITAVSISCGHMDRSYSYSFWARRGEDGWLLDAECFTHNHEVETVLDSSALSSEDVETLLEILNRSESIAYVERYQRPKTFPTQAVDETVYSFCLAFSDGQQYVTGDRQNDLEAFFYRLAEGPDKEISK